MINCNWKNFSILAFALISVLLLHGAVPFVGVPTLMQAVWTTGFSQSFANDSIFSVHATNFGLPEPAAPAFGLAGAYPVSLLIAAGLHPSEAYSLMVAVWLSLAFFGAYRIALISGMGFSPSIFGAMLWMSMPIVWAHANYSMLSLGIALLPFYFWCALRLFYRPSESKGGRLKTTGCYISACMLAVFMDGYSFVMFAVGSSILAAYIFVRVTGLRRYLLQFALSVHVFGFALAYLLYTLHLGRLQFQPSALNFFRSFGVDLAYLAIPTKGVLWIWDVLGLSVVRSDKTLFGDGSVWITTFCMPIILIGLVAWLKTRRQVRLASAFMIIALFGFYMALGPSLKVNVVKPEVMQREAPGQMSVLMPADFALMPTGNAWLYQHVPGIRNMRAAYRWSALGVFGFWTLLLLLISKAKGAGKAVGLAIMGFLLIANLPHLEKKWIEYKTNQDMFKRIDSELVADMKETMKQGELIAFLPYGNDFLVNYIASRANIRTYNIGGDKNLVIASQQWPKAMRHYGMNRIDSNLSGIILHLLSSRKADAVVLPYIDMLWAACAWPAPLKYKNELAPVIEVLKATDHVQVDQREYYALVRITSDVFLPFRYPLIISERSDSLYRALGRGWHELEREHVWSKKHAELELPAPSDCSPDKCAAILTFTVFGASEKRPVRVFLKSYHNNSKALATVIAHNGALKRIRIPLPVSSSSDILTIEIPEAASPHELQGSSDRRVLGVALRSVELSQCNQ